MTTAKDEISHTPIKQFTLTQKAECFKTLQNSKFSGRLVVSEPQNNTWVFYLYLGRLVYATGGKHAVRRWRRNLVTYCPHLANMREVRATVTELARQESKISWEYQLLSLWVDREQITRDRANKFIFATIVEINFDIAQALEISWDTFDDNLLLPSLDLIEPERVIGKAERLWQIWQNAKIADRSPNKAPVIRQPEALKQRTSAKVYQNLSSILDGKQSLRDLSVRMKRDLVTVTRSLLPYIQQGSIQLVDIEDISLPISNHGHHQTRQFQLQQTIVACVDDSPLICQTMGAIVTQAGYQFVSETDGLRSIAMLLSHKPHAIFLDLVMPDINGYEICSQLRKLAFFRNTPIIILTGNDGIVDRFRAKMVGATDFMSKPIQSDLVLAKLDRYLSLNLPSS